LHCPTLWGLAHVPHPSSVLQSQPLQKVSSCVDLSNKAQSTTLLKYALNSLKYAVTIVKTCRFIGTHSIHIHNVMHIQCDMVHTCAMCHAANREGSDISCVCRCQIDCDQYRYLVLNVVKCLELHVPPVIVLWPHEGEEDHQDCC